MTQSLAHLPNLCNLQWTPCLAFPSALYTLQSLEHLSLKIPAAGLPLGINQLPSLQSLELSITRPHADTDAAIEELSFHGFRALHSPKLQSTFTALLQGLQELTSLCHLELDTPHLESFNLAFIGKLTNLTHAELSAHVDEDFSAALGMLQSLQHLTRCADQCTTTLGQLTALTSLKGNLSLDPFSITIATLTNQESLSLDAGRFQAP